MQNVNVVVMSAFYEKKRVPRQTLEPHICFYESKLGIIIELD